MKFLLQFNNDSHWRDFKISELNSLLQLYELSPVVFSNPNRDIVFLEIEQENREHIIKIVERSVLIRAAYELWSVQQIPHRRNTILDVVGIMERVLPDIIPQLTESKMKNDLSWSLSIESIFMTLNPEQKDYYRSLFQSVLEKELKGHVKLNNPDLPLTLLLDFIDQPNFQDIHQIPAYFGRLVIQSTMKQPLSKFDLKKRNYIGPTSLNHQLVFLLGNLARIKKNDYVFDPFVGTASILIGLTSWGCVCFGADIDPRVLRGDMHAGKQREDITFKKNTKRSIFTNFHDYGLPIPEIIRLDNHECDRHFIFSESIQTPPYGGRCLFDAIVTDPPYGIRAGARKTGKAGSLEYRISETTRQDHIPTTQAYPVEEVMLDLLHTAARSLVLGGRLVYLIPTTYDFEVSDLPIHPCLELEMTCEQPLSSRHGRRAVVMRKYKDYTVELFDEFNVYKSSIMNGIHPDVNERDNSDNPLIKTSRIDDQPQLISHGFAILMTKLQKALAVDGFYDKTVMKKTSKSCLRRKESFAAKKKFREEQSKLLETHN
jgi:tRNA (guanine10-N2)-methyltransferase